jgi:hypothetical protein
VRHCPKIAPTHTSCCPSRYESFHPGCAAVSVALGLLACQGTASLPGQYREPQTPPSIYLTCATTFHYIYTSIRLHLARCRHFALKPERLLFVLIPRASSTSLFFSLAFFCYSILIPFVAFLLRPKSTNLLFPLECCRASNRRQCQKFVEAVRRALPTLPWYTRVILFSCHASLWTQRRRRRRQHRRPRAQPSNLQSKRHSISKRLGGIKPSPSYHEVRQKKLEAAPTRCRRAKRYPSTGGQVLTIIM